MSVKNQNLQFQSYELTEDAMASLKQNAAVFSAIKTGLWTIKHEKGMPDRLICDDTMCDLIGVPHDSDSKFCYDFWITHIVDGYQDAAGACVQNIRDDGRAEVTYPYNHPTAGRIYVRCGGTLVEDWGEKGFTVSGYYQDITETSVTIKDLKQQYERETESYRRELEEKNVALRKANSNMTDVISEIAERYLKIIKINLVSGIFKKIKDDENIYQGGDIQELLWSPITHGRIFAEDVEGYRAFTDLKRVRELINGQSDSMKQRYRKKIGEEWHWIRYEFVRSTEYTPENPVIVFFVQDIQSEVTSELVMKEAYHALDRASTAKTDFLSHMSHDIRTPINGIIGMTAIANAHIEDQVRVLDCLKKITSSSHHLLSLINEILVMSKIESGNLELSEEEFSMEELVESLMMVMKPEIEAKNHEFSIDIKGIQHDRVIGDSLKLQQVLTNLLSNAIKYTPEGGNIQLSIKEKIPAQDKMGCFELVVEDNGIGIPEDFIPHIFEPFSRGENGLKAKGTGLGMAITKNIVNMMQGDIHVESKQGEGTKFTVTVMLGIAGENRRSYEELKGLEVLVVDDDETICESTCLLLDELGIHGEMALNGAEALRKIEERHKNNNGYFAVIVDWKMPDMDGVEVCRRIREDIHEKSPMIIFSSYDWSDIEQEARRVGVDMFIGKPVFKPRLIHTFLNLLGMEEKQVKPNPLMELSEKQSFEGYRVLLAEDNELNAEIAIEILSMIGLEVKLARNGKEAVDMMAESEEGFYHIIFLDIQMPIMNGNDAARGIRGLPRKDAKTVPIYAMSANAFVDDIQTAIQSGMNGHIAKPIDMDKLFKILDKWLGKKEEPEKEDIVEEVSEQESQKETIIKISDDPLSREEMQGRYGAAANEKDLGIANYNHALFDAQAFFTKTCWEVHLKDSMVIIMQDELLPENVGRRMNYQWLIAEYRDMLLYEEDREAWSKLMNLHSLQELNGNEVHEIRFFKKGEVLTYRVAFALSRDEAGRVYVCIS